MRKIKSVKTKLLYSSGFEIIPIGTEGWKEADLWRFTSNFSTVSYSEEWILKRESIFAIEYEPEEFELKRYTEYGFLDYDSFMERELNRLADWCDGQSEKDDRYGIIGIMCGKELSHYGNTIYFYQGLKFNSCQSANLFITELNKPANSDYKNYFIELLKKTRL